ncbi:transcriptional regulator MarR family/acetyltransferase [Dehalogenimonas sp. WBC-2]|nr:transcriptional regulator MarR family/acetyltransferase [Dehalogenimonas sp. WBC-2]
MSTDNIVYKEGFQPGFLGRMTQMQGEYYDVVHQVPGLNFEVMMARQMCDFHEQYIDGRDVVLTAHAGDMIVGYIAVVGSQQERTGARLRWFLIDERYRGQGIGRELLARAIDFCRAQGFTTAWLWTMEHLERARSLYESAGFKYTADSTIDIPEHGLILELTLD